MLNHIIICFKMHRTVILILNGCLGLDSMPDDKILVLVSRPGYQGLGLKFFKGLDNKSDQKVNSMRE